MKDLSRRGVLALATAAGMATLPGIGLGAAPAAAPDRHFDDTLTRIAFGSCAKQDKEQPIWTAVEAANPDLFIFLGDNVYGDTRDMSVLQGKYALLAGKPGFQRIRSRARHRRQAVPGTAHRHRFTGCLAARRRGSSAAIGGSGAGGLAQCMRADGYGLHQHP